MTYIIENANLYLRNQWVRSSLLVNGGKILAVKKNFSKYKYMKMDIEDFWLSATFTFWLPELPDSDEKFNKKNFLIRNFLQRGCTTVLASEKVNYLHELTAKINEIRSFFAGTPLDFIVSVRISADMLTVPLIHKLKKEKIPALFIEYNDKRQLYKIPWGWIREALFPYNPPFIPVPAGKQDEKKLLLQVWNKVLQAEKIPHVEGPIKEDAPISLEALKKIGIYPLKGYLQTGGELSYNLYLNDPATEETGLKEVHPVITVHKGDVVRVLNKIFYNPDKGEEAIIRRPAFLN